MIVVFRAVVGRNQGGRLIFPIEIINISKFTPYIQPTKSQKININNTIPKHMMDRGNLMNNLIKIAQNGEKIM